MVIVFVKAICEQEGTFRKIAILTLALLFIFPLKVHSVDTWHPTGGPEGGIINALAVDSTNGQTVYAGTFRGLFKTTTAGTSWSAVNAGLTNTDINALAIDPNSRLTPSMRGLIAAASSGALTVEPPGALSIRV